MLKPLYPAYRISAAVLLILLACGCATHKPDYSFEGVNWREEFLPPAEKPVYSFFLIGDAGLPHSITAQSTFELMQEKMAEAPEEQGVIFLGDNVYPKGIPHEDAPNYEREVEKLYGQYLAIKDYEGDIVFIPGNHDWGYGRQSLKREDDLIEAWVGEKKLFLPDWGCSGPEDKDLTDEVVLLAIDSQWYMEDWDRYENINRDCDCQSRSEFLLKLKDELSKLKDKTVLLAVHHPLRSYGPHGGQYSWENEFFPFLELNRFGYFPMPILAGLLRRNLGISQDVTNPGYEMLVNDLWEATRGMKNVIFISGHEHTLQYIEDEDHPYIVSGAGAKRSPASAGGYAKYTSGQGGFVQLDFYADGSAYAKYFNGLTGDLDFATEIMPKDTTYLYDFSFYEARPDSFVTSIYDPETYPPDVTRALWGKLNREMYYDSIKMEVFYFDDYPHNLRPNRRGGGNQTNSLHLIDDLEHEYQLRSVKKDGSRILGGVFKGTFVVDMLEDVFTYGHPYGAFVLGELADSSMVYHANPKLVYMPKQPGLGMFNEDFGDAVYLFEERPDEDGSHVASFGNSPEIIGTDDVMEEIVKGHEHIIDTAWMMRSRIFDFMIGDWDRHQDNWRWASFEADSIDGVMYRPIPRDRDMVFTDFSGFMVSILNKTLPQLRQFQSYEKEIPRMKWYGEYPKFYDRRFIGPVEWGVWEREAKYIQEHVSDAVIERAMRQMPESGFEYSGEELIEIMKYRRDHLVEIVREYYELLAENVVVLGTNDKDYVEVKRLNRNETLVRVLVEDEDDSTRTHLRYRRIFYTDETDEVRIFGLEEDDEFHISGSAKNGIEVRIIGGYGEDVVVDESQVKGWYHHTKVYDYPGGVELTTSKETKPMISTRYDYNNYEFKDFQRDYSLILPMMSYNPDFGFSGGLSWLRYAYGYKKRPDAYHHRVNLSYAFGNRSVTASYHGVLNNTFNYWGLSLGALVHGPRFTLNYFGEGNEAEKDEDKEREYYQVRQREISVAVGLRRPFKYNSGYFEIQPFYTHLKAEATEGRFITEVSDAEIRGANIFEPMDISGLSLNFLYDTRNNNSIPTRGLVADFKLRYRDLLNGPEDNASFKSKLTFYQRLTQNDFLVWATLLGYEHIFGDYLFFQSAYVGGMQSLRGFRMGRFRGRSSFWNSNDVRMNFGEVKNKLLPFDAGIFGAFDHGRVWHSELSSSVYHYTYGGGVFVNIIDIVSATLGYHIGNEEGQWLFQLGFNF